MKLHPVLCEDHWADPGRPATAPLTPRQKTLASPRAAMLGRKPRHAILQWGKSPASLKAVVPR